MNFAAIAAMIAVAAAAPPSVEDAKLAAFFDKYLEVEFARHPYDATQYGDHRHDDRLDDLSAPARAAGLAATRQALADLRTQINVAQLSSAGRIDFEILQHHLNRSIWLAENTKPWEEDPRGYNEYLTNSIYLLFTQSTLPREQNVRNAASRIRGIPAVVAAARANLRVCPKQFVETAIQQNKGAISFYEAGLFSLAGESASGSPLTEPAAIAVRSLREYQEFLEKEFLPRATGEWRLGRARFEKKLEFELDAGLSADEVIREAESEATRVEHEMVVIARQLWARLFPGKALPPDDPLGRRTLVRTVLQKLSDDRGTAQSLVADATTTVAGIRKFIAERDILRLPDPDRCRIVEMPEFQRGQSTAYLNPAPPLDARADSYYAVSPPPAGWSPATVESYFREYNRAMLQILTIHEAYPGHYVQLEYSNRCPSKIRKLLSSGTFVEGWAVYTEQMMLDQGYGDGDLSLRLHQLKWYLRAVVNAILDHRMHCTGMTDEEALELLVDRAYQTEGEARGKIIRAKQSSCQLSTYFVGRMALYRLRQQIQREQGEAFHLGRYHEAVLDFGSLPVKYLPDLVRERLKQPR
ncbi:MAG: DUF885 domain-containing protein [Gemmataceae bacterium]|nr:DUF885 domain-containing protein [Gemmataceae bacterium]